MPDDKTSCDATSCKEDLMQGLLSLLAQAEDAENASDTADDSAHAADDARQE